MVTYIEDVHWLGEGEGEVSRKADTRMLCYNVMVGVKKGGKCKKVLKTADVLYGRYLLIY